MGINRHEIRYQPVSQRRSYFARTQYNPSTPVKKPRVARPPPSTTKKPRLQFQSPERSQPETPISREAWGTTRVAIKDVFTRVLGSPPEEVWIESGTIPEIINRLSLARGSWGTVRRVCREVLDDPSADVAREAPGKGRAPLLADLTEQAEVVYNALEGGNSVATVTILLNTGYRATHGLGPISYSAVQRFVQSSEIIHMARRKTKKKRQRRRRHPMGYSSFGICEAAG